MLLWRNWYTRRSQKPMAFMLYEFKSHQEHQIDAVDQLDRSLGSEPRGREFESHPYRHVDIYRVDNLI